MMRAATQNVIRRARRFRNSKTKAMAAVSIKTQVFIFVIMALMTRAPLLNDISPFSAACFAAGLFAGWPPVTMLLGVIVGCRYEVLSYEALLPLLGAMIIYAGSLLLRLLPADKQPKSSEGESLFRSQDALAAALAGIGGLLPGLILSHGLPYNMLMALLSGIVAMATAPLFRTAMAVKPSRQILSADEQLALILALMIALLGVKGIPFIGVYAPAYFASLITLIAAGQGAGLGTMMGVISGVVLALTGNDPFIGASLGLCGALAGLTRGLGRPASAVAFSAGNAATLLYGLGYSYGALNPIGVLLIGVAYCLIPLRWINRLADWVKEPTYGHDPERLAARVRQTAEKRVRALGSVFSELSVGYANDSTHSTDENLLISRMRTRLCESCSAYEKCWGGSDRRASRMLCELLTTTLKGEPLSESSELPPHMAAFCRRKSAVARRLGGLLTEFHEQRQAAICHKGNNSIMSAQFDQAALILKGLGDKLNRPLYVNRERARITAAALDREGIPPEEILALENDGLELILTLKDRMWTRELVERALDLLSTELGVPLRAAVQTDGLTKELRLCEAPRFTATVGVSCRPAKKDTPCGDSHIAAGLTGSRLLLALSDGMGSGPAASRESADTLRLLQRFLSADVPQELALDAMNNLLLMMSGEDMFATVDLCVLDLQTGRATLNKLSACATVIVRGGGITRVEGGRLPLGIVEKIVPLTATVRLHPGDLLVMVTDGVADSARDGEQQWLETTIRKNRGLSPQALCDAINRGAGTREGITPDDRTVLAVRIGRA